MSEEWFKPSKALTFDTVQADSKRFQVLLNNMDATTIKLDLNDVNECDSAGLALLIEIKRLCVKYQKKLVIEKPPKVILSLAEFCGVETMLNAK